VKELYIEKYLDKRVKALGGFTRKLKYIGRRGAPDRLVFYKGVRFVELKAPNKKPDPVQMGEHATMTTQGAIVHVLSNLYEVDHFIKELESIK
jgi:hypothetical protein